MNNTNDLTNPPVCKGVNCDFAIDMSAGEGLCLTGGGTCLDGDLLEAEPSGFHDDNLIDATQRIRQILSAVPADQNGRKLSFFVTEMGILLAWASHGETVPPDAVTAKDGKEAVAKALKLKVR